MVVNPTVALTIAGMAGVTYLTRVGGIWVMNRMTIGPRLAAWLKALPGTILISIVAPAVIGAGVAEGISGAITTVVAWRSRSIVVAMAVGVASVWCLRMVV